jgi:hypothetical protein
VLPAEQELASIDFEARRHRGGHRPVNLPERRHRGGASPLSL